MFPHPRPESIDFFERSISNHSKTRWLERLEDCHYVIHRKGLPSYEVLITDYYTLGLADYLEIKEEYPLIQGIVTLSNWNGYTHQAKATAKQQNVGIFIMSELLGALNWNEPHKYIKKDPEGNIVFFGKC